ncbi:MAG: leucine-rich repeat domain-containing protein [Bacteroidales bacterium]|nr:leucine-rich repeat domain-containing protein [Bacteroidales bacterium]
MSRTFKNIVIAASMLLFATNLLAYDFQSGGLYYTITSPNTVEVVRHSSYTYIDTITIPASVRYNNRNLSVTRIADSAFYGCTGLQRATLCNTITSIGDYAFYMCSSFSSVTIPASVITIGDKAYAGCRYLQTLSFASGSSLTSIGEEAFSSCTISSISLPNSLVTIGNGAFRGNPITTLTIPNNVTSIGDDAFLSCTSLRTINFGTSLVSIGSYAFGNCSSITTLTIPSNIRRIGSQAFWGCSSLSRVNYGGTIAQWCGIFFGDHLANPTTLTHALYINNQNVTSVSLPNTVDTIGQYCFYYDTCITSMTIPGSVKYIGKFAFMNTTHLASMNFTGTIAQWCDIVFQNKYSNPLFRTHNLYMNSQLVTSLVIPNTVDTIRNHCFYTDTSIISITLPNSTKHIGDSAFYGCPKFTSLDLPDSLVTYGRCAFGSCTGLTSIEIPATVTYAGPYGFAACTGLTFVRLMGANTYFFGNSLFTLPTSLPIYIPCGSRNNYSSLLGSYTNTIEEFRFAFSVSSQDTLQGTAATVTSPTCSNNSIWTVRATPASGYRFSRWSDGNTQNPRNLTVTRDTNLVAYFAIITYNFSVVSEDTNKGTVVITTQPTQANPQASFAAVPKAGFTFTRWSDGNTQNPRTITLTQDTALVAHFASVNPQWYTFNVVSEDTNKGTVVITTQPTQANPQASFAAVPKTGFTFARWSDGNIQNPRTITVTQDTVIIAYFSANQGIAVAENADIAIYPNPASDKFTIEGLEENSDIFIINTLGSIVKHFENVSETTTISVGDLPKGVYMVRAGNAVRKLIIVE